MTSMYGRALIAEHFVSELLKIAASEQLVPAPGEYAPGIPRERVIKKIPAVKEEEGNAQWTASLAKHPAARRGDHFDLRVVDDDGNAHSWAIAKIPEPGKGGYAAQQPTHTKEYALRSKPFSIPQGVYGGTRPGERVESVYVQPVEVISANDDRVHLLRHRGQKTEELVLKRVSTPIKGSPLWALRNATKTRETREGQQLPSSKPAYREKEPGAIDFNDDSEVMLPKIDGAHVLVDLKGPDKMMRVFSYRPSERKTGLIEHTFKFPNFQNRRSGTDTKNTLIRAELWASRGDKAIPAAELGGLLNAGVVNSRTKQQDQGVKLRLTGIDVVRHDGKSVETAPFDAKLKILEQVSKSTHGLVETPRVARRAAEKRSLLERIESGVDPETSEGVILQNRKQPAPPTKAKLRPDHDVYLRDVFTKSKSEHRGWAGGFSYSHTPDGPIVGRVGSGFPVKLRKDMLEHPEKFIGRVAKVKSLTRTDAVTEGKALRAPSFKEWHIDKTPPELMQEG